jgi:hypothetical protein
MLWQAIPQRQRQKSSVDVVGFGPFNEKIFLLFVEFV